MSNKFSNRMFAIDGDPNGDGNPADAAIVGSLVLNPTSTTRTDDIVTGLAGQGGQGVLAIPVVYNGWVQNLPSEWSSKLTAQSAGPHVLTSQPSARTPAPAPGRAIRADWWRAEPLGEVAQVALPDPRSTGLAASAVIGPAELPAGSGAARPR